ncbi:MAG: D-amino-acid transaminase [Rhodospirillaceae bacterium]
MSRFAYVNGRYERHGLASVSIEDRGYQFADGVYEVIAIWNGLPVDFCQHMYRLERSMSELRFAARPHLSALSIIGQRVVRLNRVVNGILYIQISRGTATRNHSFPHIDSGPSVVMTSRSGVGPTDKQVTEGVNLVIQSDERWGRRDIKSVGLLANALAKQRAIDSGAFDALLVNPDGTVTEASTANIWLVGEDDTLITRPLGSDILGGITRARILALAKKAGYRVKEKIFTTDEALTAKEIFLTGTTTFVLPVVQVDNTIIGGGSPGRISSVLRDSYKLFLDDIGAESWHVKE